MILSFVDTWTSIYPIHEIVWDEMTYCLEYSFGYYQLGILPFMIIVHTFQNIPGGLPWRWTVGDSEKI